PVIVPHHDIFRLDVAMYDPGFMSGDQGRRDLNRHVKRCAQAETRAAERCAEGLSINELDGDEVPLVNLPDFMNGDDIRMIQRRGGSCLLLKTTNPRSIRG